MELQVQLHGSRQHLGQRWGPEGQQVPNLGAGRLLLALCPLRVLTCQFRD